MENYFSSNPNKQATEITFSQAFTNIDYGDAVRSAS